MHPVGTCYIITQAHATSVLCKIALLNVFKLEGNVTPDMFSLPLLQSSSRERHAIALYRAKLFS